MRPSRRAAIGVLISWRIVSPAKLQETRDGTRDNDGDDGERARRRAPVISSDECCRTSNLATDSYSWTGIAFPPRRRGRSPTDVVEDKRLSIRAGRRRGSIRDLSFNVRRGGVVRAGRPGNADIDEASDYKMGLNEGNGLVKRVRGKMSLRYAWNVFLLYRLLCSGHLDFT